MSPFHSAINLKYQFNTIKKLQRHISIGDTNMQNLHHVGIVLPTEDRAMQLIELLGMEEDSRGYVEQYEALCIFTKGSGGSPLELVIPSGGILKKFNRGTGGLHHIAIKVDDLNTTKLDMNERGIKLLEDEPVKGGGPFLCNFLSPVYTRGTLVEFVQALD